MHPDEASSRDASATSPSRSHGSGFAREEGGLDPTSWPRLGGMATPLGVYLTTGRYSAGGGTWRGLALNGVSLAIAAGVAHFAFLLAFALASIYLPALYGLNAGWQVLLENLFTLAAILILIRLTPMSGLHGAEHMTVNAVESGYPLTIAAIRSQSRIHRRCGTNLMALLAGLTLGWLTLEAMGPMVNGVGQGVFVAVSALLLWRYWHAIGAWLQRHFTTAPPTDAQLQSALDAACHTLRQYGARPHPPPPLWRRFWTSGLMQTLAGYFATSWLLARLAPRLAATILRMSPL